MLLTVPFVDIAYTILLVSVFALTMPFVDIVYAILLVGLFALMALAILGLKMVTRLRSQMRRVEK